MKLGVGARSLAMGRTAAGLAGDINSLFINPANAAYLEGWAGTSMYTSLLEGDITYTLLGGASKSKWGTLGISYLGGGSSGIQVATRDADSRIVASGSSFDYSNSVISLVYGKEVREDLAAGATFKLFSKGFTGSAGSSGSGFDLDLGLLWKPRENLTVGVSQQNTLPASIASLTWGSGEKEGIPFNTKIGLAFTPRDNLLLTGDLDYASNTPLVFHGGIEWKFRDNLDLRAGFDQVPINQSEAATNLGAGIGLDFRGFSFDYAYYLDSLLSENSTHYFTVSYAVARPKKVAVEKVVVKEAPTPEVVKKVLPRFSDVPDGYWAKEAIEALAASRVIGGYPDGTFKPAKILTRAELCTLLIKAKKVKIAKPTKKRFKDLSLSHWAAPYIHEAAKLKFVSGYPNGTFKASRTLSRVEGVLILSRFANLKLIRQKSPYSDLPAAHWAAPNIAAAKKAGLLNYITGDFFNPKKSFSRAEAAYILHSVLK